LQDTLENKQHWIQPPRSAKVANFLYIVCYRTIRFLTFHPIKLNFISGEIHIWLIPNYNRHLNYLHVFRMTSWSSNTSCWIAEYEHYEFGFYTMTPACSHVEYQSWLVNIDQTIISNSYGQAIPVQNEIFGGPLYFALCEHFVIRMSHFRRQSVFGSGKAP